jgi:uncharacterized protein YjiS (DUF1127 family)
MSRSLVTETTVGFAPRPTVAWRPFFDRAGVIIQNWRERVKQRRELIAYMASDHRVAADIGVTHHDARDWAERPFWRP